MSSKGEALGRDLYARVGARSEFFEEVADSGDVPFRIAALRAAYLKDHFKLSDKKQAEAELRLRFALTALGVILSPDPFNLFGLSVASLSAQERNLDLAPPGMHDDLLRLTDPMDEGCLVLAAQKQDETYRLWIAAAIHGLRATDWSATDFASAACWAVHERILPERAFSFVVTATGDTPERLLAVLAAVRLQTESHAPTNNHLGTYHASMNVEKLGRVLTSCSRLTVCRGHRSARPERPEAIG